MVYRISHRARYVHEMQSGFLEKQLGDQENVKQKTFTIVREIPYQSTIKKDRGRGLEGTYSLKRLS